jgi:hypothetical protein
MPRALTATKHWVGQSRPLDGLRVSSIRPMSKQFKRIVSQRYRPRLCYATVPRMTERRTSPSPAFSIGQALARRAGWCFIVIVVLCAQWLTSHESLGQNVWVAVIVASVTAGLQILRRNRRPGR